MYGKLVNSLNTIVYDMQYVSLTSLILFLPVAFDPLDPFGNITIKWDVISWTADGYVVSFI